MSFNNKQKLTGHDTVVARYKEDLLAWHKEYIPEVLHLAEMHALQNHPGLMDTSYEPLISPIRAAYDAKKHDATLAFQVKAIKANIAINGAASKKKEELINECLSDLDTKHRNADLDVRRFTSDVNLKRYRRARLYLWLLSCGECLWMALAFLGFGHNYLLSGIIGLSIGAGQVLLVQKIVHSLQLIRDYAERVLWTRRAVAGAIIWSSLVGIARSMAPNSLVTGTLPSGVLPIIFAAVNLFFIVTTAFITLHDIPTEGEIRRALKHEEMCKKCKDLADEMEQQNGNKLSLVNNHAELVNSGNVAENDEIEIHRFIDDLFREALGLYINENIMRRGDHQIPISFYQTLKIIT